MAAVALKIISQGRVAAPVAVRAFSASASRRINEGPNTHKPNHTGVVWDKEDYRNVRFVDRDKLINPNWAIDLIAEDPVVVVNGSTVWSNSCGSLGHPKVFINLDKPEVAVCGYSGRKFIQKKYYDPSRHGESITYDEYLEQMTGDSR